VSLVVADRVQETASAPGTGTISLGGASASYQTFVSGIGSGNTTYYVALDVTANTWEVGLGTVTSGSPATLSRDTVLSNSSGTTAKINFANAVTVWCDYPAGKAVYEDANGDTSIAGADQAAEQVATNGLLVHNATVGSSYSVPSGYNVISAGPVTVASGATVTLPSGSNWVVV
jgi:hypothetical protein